MLRKILLFVLCLVIGFVIYSFQNSAPIKYKTIPIKAEHITTDYLGNIYISTGDELIKYDSNGEVFKKFSDKTLGNITNVDASNPLKILLFYKDFSRILLLDDMLSPNSNTIFLDKIGLEQSTLACSSHNNGIWVYNQQNFELTRLDQNLVKTIQTGNLSQVLGVEIHPNYLTQYNNWLYLNNPETGILVFDIYGTYYKTVPIKGLNQFEVYNEQFFYFENSKLKSFHQKTLESAEIEVSDTSALGARIEKGKLIVHLPDRVELFHLN